MYKNNLKHIKKMGVYQNILYFCKINYKDELGTKFANS